MQQPRSDERGHEIGATMTLNVENLEISEVKIIRPRKHPDSRGFLSETYNKQTFAEAGFTDEFVQDNHIYSQATGVVRGLHYQTQPYAQAKLVRVARGRIFDVVVDIRRNSPTFGKWVSAEISADAWNQIYMPIGFAHGFCTLEAETEVIYKVTNFYSAQHDCGIRWNDPELCIPWPVSIDQAVISDKDGKQPYLKDALRLS
jgi:dTDP-4-dehydrorhamnose 3,5-epimerase